MYCTNCGKQALDNERFCGNCGTSLCSENTAFGDGSANVVGNNIFNNSPIHVGDVFQSEKFKNTAFIDRTYVKQLKVANNPIKVSWFILSGGVGFIGSLASIYSVLGSDLQFVFFLTFSISLSLFFIGITLKRIRFSYLKWFNLEANKQGDVFLTKVGGSCPICDGYLRLVDLQVAKDRYRTFVRCDRIRDHIWNFDPSVLD